MLISCAALLMVSLSPMAAAGTVCLLRLLSGPWGVLGIIALVSSFPCFDLG